MSESGSSRAPGDAAVCADRVSKVYRIYDSAGDRLREMVFRRRRHREFHALSGVSFALPRGSGISSVPLFSR